jgi:hypothetical protein
VPDYFDSEFTPGYVTYLKIKDEQQKAVEYKVGSETFTALIEGWGASQVSKGEKVQVIYNPTTPAEGSLYTFFAYWLKLSEILTGATVFCILFVGAVAITGENEPDDPPSNAYPKKRKYAD